MQKHAKQLRCDVNSQQFKDTMRYLWMPRLVERIQASASTSTGSATTSSCVTTPSDQFLMTSYDAGLNNNNNTNMDHLNFMSNPNGYVTQETSSVSVSPTSGLTEYHIGSEVEKVENNQDQSLVGPQIMSPPQNYLDVNGGLLSEDLTQSYHNWFENDNGMISPYSDNFWNIGSDEDFWLLLQQQQQLVNNGSF